MLVMLNVTKEAHEILRRKMFESLRVTKSAADKFLLTFLKSDESFVDSAFEDQAIDVRFRLLTDAKDTAERYVLNWVSLRIDFIQFSSHQPCCSIKELNHRSTQIILEAMVRFRPKPPHLSEAIKTCFPGSVPNSSIALSRCLLFIPPWYCGK